MGDLDTRYAVHPTELAVLTTAGLRARVLLDGLFAPGEARLALAHEDRLVVGGVLTAAAPVPLPCPAELRAEELLDRREAGIVCLAGPGEVQAGGARHTMEAEDVLYLGKGTGPVAFGGEGAAFYLVSTLAHAEHPAVLSRRDAADAVTLGEPEQANVRTIRKHVWSGGVQSAQLAMGVTTLAPGSVWNTMPAHLHERRTEVYLYFGLPEDQRVVHLCGRPDATRNLIVADREAVISPPWSIHTGAGTSGYRFVWATGGENLTYDDMDPVATGDLR